MNTNQDHDRERTRAAGVVNAVLQSDVGCFLAMVLGLGALFVCVLGGLMAGGGW